jgi:hypothetical protein
MTLAVLFIRGVPFKFMMKANTAVENWLFNDMVSPQNYLLLLVFFLRKKRIKNIQGILLSKMSP